MTKTTDREHSTLQFREMPRQDLIAYAKWFHESTPARLEALIRAVKSTSGYEGWAPDQTPDSLQALSGWFEKQVRSQSAGQEQSVGGGLPVAIANLALDVGTYFAQVVLGNVPGTRWDQKLQGSKNFIDYGQPVLVGFGKVRMNPARLMVTNVYAVLGQKQVDLRSLYDVWARMQG